MVPPTLLQFFTSMSWGDYDRRDIYSEVSFCDVDLDKKGDGERTILVFHFGGATYDLTLLTLDDGLFEVIATDGDPYLGESFCKEHVNLIRTCHYST